MPRTALVPPGLLIGPAWQWGAVCPWWPVAVVIDLLATCVSLGKHDLGDSAGDWTLGLARAAEGAQPLSQSAARSPAP